MAECAECGKKTMSFTCHYCGKKFCSEHRLPENHDCGGLDSGKKEEYMSGKEEKEESSSNQGTSRKSAPNQEKWFKDRDVKSEVRRNSSSMPRILTDIKNTFKNSYTLSIILVTSLFFLAHQTIPGLARLLMLYPALTEAAAASAGYSQTLLTHPWGLLSVILVHGGLFHLLANMVTFYFFGTTLEKNIGSRKLLKFYVGTGILASIGYVLFTNLLYLIHGAELAGALTPAVGASGAVVAAVGTIAVLYPDAEVLLYFIIPMKIRTAVGIFGVIEVLNLTAKLAGFTIPVIGGFASSAHLTGLLAGIWFGKKVKENYGRRQRINIFG